MAWAPLAAAGISLVGGWLMNKYGGENKDQGYGMQRTGTKAAEQFQKQLFRNQGGLGGDPNYQQGSDYLRRLYSNDPELMAQFERPYMENFNENIAPNIANRFAGMGTGASGLSSSGFQQTLAQAGRGLQGDLANMRANQQMQGLNPALAYAQQPISNKLNAMQWSPYQSTYTPRQSTSGDAMLQMAPGLAGSAFQNYMNTPSQNPQSNLNTMSQSVQGAAYNPR